jgi:hypothetical protein
MTDFRRKTERQIMSEQNQLSKELTGEVIAISEPKTVGSSNYPKAEIVVRIENGNYPQEIPVDAGGKKAKLFVDAGVVIGDTVKLQCNITGRKGGARWYSGISAWKCEVQGARRREDVPPKSKPEQSAFPALDDSGEENLPF